MLKTLSPTVPRPGKTKRGKRVKTSKPHTFGTTPAISSQPDSRSSAVPVWDPYRKSHPQNRRAAKRRVDPAEEAPPKGRCPVRPRPRPSPPSPGRPRPRTGPGRPVGGTAQKGEEPTTPSSFLLYARSQPPASAPSLGWHGIMRQPCAPSRGEPSRVPPLSAARHRGSMTARGPALGLLLLLLCPAQVSGGPRPARALGGRGGGARRRGPARVQLVLGKLVQRWSPWRTPTPTPAPGFFPGRALFFLVWKRWQLETACLISGAHSSCAHLISGFRMCNHGEGRKLVQRRRDPVYLICL